MMGLWMAEALAITAGIEFMKGVRTWEYLEECKWIIYLVLSSI